VLQDSTDAADPRQGTKTSIGPTVAFASDIGYRRGRSSPGDKDLPVAYPSGPAGWVPTRPILARGQRPGGAPYLTGTSIVPTRPILARGQRHGEDQLLSCVLNSTDAADPRQGTKTRWRRWRRL